MTNRGGSVDIEQMTDDPRYPGKPWGCDYVDFNINYHGDVFPCCHSFQSNYVLGNIKDSMLEEIWEHNAEQFNSHYTGDYQYACCAACKDPEPVTPSSNPMTYSKGVIKNIKQTILRPF